MFEDWRMTNANLTKQGSLRSAWLILVLALAYGAALAGVETALAPRVQFNKRQQTYAAIPELVPGAIQEKTLEIVVPLDGVEQRVYQTFSSVGTHNGWVVPASGIGFADRIELLIGTDPQLTTLTGLYVLDQKETPGLGDYIAQPEFRQRFENRPLDLLLQVVKHDPASPNEVQAISGATVSSQSVCSIVNEAIRRWREPILRAASERNGEVAE
jgi:electron transport complex protein RnfG